MHTDIAPREPKNLALLHACKTAGGQKALAVSIDRTQGTVWEWLYVSGVVPAGDAVKIEQRHGIPAESLNADLAAYARLRRLRVRKLKTEQGRAAA